MQEGKVCCRRREEELALLLQPDAMCVFYQQKGLQGEGEEPDDGLRTILCVTMSD